MKFSYESSYKCMSWLVARCRAADMLMLADPRRHGFMLRTALCWHRNLFDVHERSAGLGLPDGACFQEDVLK